MQCIVVALHSVSEQRIELAFRVRLRNCPVCARILYELLCSREPLAMVALLFVENLLVDILGAVPMQSRRIETAHLAYVQVLATLLARIIEAWLVSIRQESATCITHG